MIEDFKEFIELNKKRGIETHFILSIKDKIDGEWSPICSFSTYELAKEYEAYFLKRNNDKKYINTVITIIDFYKNNEDWS